MLLTPLDARRNHGLRYLCQVLYHRWHLWPKNDGSTIEILTHKEDKDVYPFLQYLRMIPRTSLCLAYFRSLDLDFGNKKHRRVGIRCLERKRVHLSIYIFLAVAAYYPVNQSLGDFDLEISRLRRR
jgi:hypothetical protein